MQPKTIPSVNILCGKNPNPCTVPTENLYQTLYKYTGYTLKTGAFIKTFCLLHAVIDVNCVKKCIKSLKRNKCDGTCNITTDHVLNASEKLSIYLSFLFSCMLSHGFAPTGFLESRIIPIPKSKRKSLNDLSNYRGIAMSSVLGKVLDTIVISLHGNVLETCDMQFGFKQKHSTTQCTAIVEEIISYYRNRNSSVYLLMLDASQAFDRVNYKKLFTTLLGRGMCFLTVRLLFFIYINQVVSVTWGGCSSPKFTVSNGVKQGGVLSPLLFTVYMDNLFKNLANCGFGCYVGNLFSGAFGYADDVVLLAPKISSLHKLYDVCKQYGQEHNIIFNPHKSKLLAYGSDIEGCMLDNSLLSCQPYEKHIGHIIGPQAIDQEIKSKTNELIVNTNHILSVFKSASFEIKYKLFKTYSMPLYGCVLWDHSSQCMDKLYVTWRKCVRKLLNVPFNTHSVLLPIICNDLNIDCQLHKRVIKFFACLAKSGNIYNKLTFQLITQGNKSKMSNSFNHLSYIYGFDKHSFSDINMSSLLRKISCHYHDSLPVWSLVFADVVKYMLTLLSHKEFSVFSYQEIKNYINFCCTT